MQEMTHQHTRELDIYYNEHRKACTNCGKQFQDGMTAHLGYLADKTPAVLCDDCSQLLSETVVRYYWMKPKYEEVLPTAKLWRYMDLSKFISLIGKKKLYFPSLESFEDIFEGAKGIAERKEKWDNFYLDFFKQAIQTAPGMNPKDLTDQYIEENAVRLLSEMETGGKFERKNTFVSCWHCDQYESEAMWKLYSTNVKNALAIQTTCQQLYEALGKDPSMLPYKSLCFTGIKDRHGVYAMIGKDERRDVSIRRPRPSIRKQLTDSKQAASPKKAAARTKKKELEV